MKKLSAISNISLQHYRCRLQLVFPLLTIVCLVSHSTILTAQLSLTWAKSMGGGEYDFGRCVAVDDSGNVYSTGQFYGLADFDPGPGTANLTPPSILSDIYLSKLDAGGNLVWAKRMGSYYDDFGNSVVVDGAGNVYSTGLFSFVVDFDPGPGTANLTAADFGDAYIQKLDASGNFVWAKQFVGTNSSQGSSRGLSIKVDKLGNLYCIGTFGETADFDPGAGTFNLDSNGEWDIFVIKLDTAGDFVWAKSIGGLNYDYGQSIAVDGAGNVYAAGAFLETVDFDPGAGTAFMTADGVVSAFILKLDASGNFVWAKSMVSAVAASCFSIEVDSAGNVYSTGEFSETVDFDPGPEIKNLTSIGSSAIYIQKLDTDGNYVWAKSMGSTEGDSRGYSIELDDAGNAYSTGRFTGTVDFNPGAGVMNLTAMAGNNDVYMQKLDASGNFVWAASIPSKIGERPIGMALDKDNNVYASGYFHDTADFDPSAGIFELTSAGNADIYVLKWRQQSVSSTEAWETNDGIFIYPNPASASFSVRNPREDAGTITLTDMTGKIWLTRALTGKEEALEINPGIPPGFYLLHLVMNNGSIAVEKLVIQSK